MQTKLFEVRDRATFIPVIATRLDPSSEEDRYLLGRAGYGRTAELQKNYVLLSRLAGGETHYDFSQWPNRTMGSAHAYIRNCWDDLHSGDVIDVEYILGESESPKVSERNVTYG